MSSITCTCPKCNIPMDVVTRPSTLRVSRATGQQYLIPESTIVTCRNRECEAFEFTFDIRSIDDMIRNNGKGA